MHIPTQSTNVLAATEDGLPRPGCADLSDCWEWARGQCKHSQDSGLLVKSYCFDEYCYALCPPALPIKKPAAFVSSNPRTSVVIKGSTPSVTSKPSTSVVVEGSAAFVTSKPKASAVIEHREKSGPSDFPVTEQKSRKWKPGMPPPKGKPPVETWPSVEGIWATAAQNTARQTVFSTPSSDTTLVKRTVARNTATR